MITHKKGADINGWGPPASPTHTEKKRKTHKRRGRRRDRNDIYLLIRFVSALFETSRFSNLLIAAASAVDSFQGGGIGNGPLRQVQGFQ
ncbi:hypothetical protein AKJ16_DCAP11358 [Drosera capensis]